MSHRCTLFHLQVGTQICSALCCESTLTPYEPPPHVLVRLPYDGEVPPYGRVTLAPKLEGVARGRLTPVRLVLTPQFLQTGIVCMDGMV